MPGGLRILANELPGTVTRLKELGARDHNMIGGAWGIGDTGAEQPDDKRFRTLATRWPVLEAALLEAALETPGITMRWGMTVSGLLSAPMSGMLKAGNDSREKGPLRLSPAKTLRTVGTTGFEPATP
ncbi:hypothetical protein ABT124_50405 [Streptomyces sp. NPDC001982]|uniref:hypothetical protein n=1 Tax=unclassified Streptomyces TaxID=2593676 RepID=UPI003330EFBA